MFESSSGVPHTEAFDALFAREKLGSTCLGAACAIPHGRVSGIDKPCAVFLRTSAPLALDAPDGRAVQLFLCDFCTYHSTKFQTIQFNFTNFIE